MAMLYLNPCCSEVCYSEVELYCKVSYFYAPNFEKVGSILLSACPFVCLFVCPSVQKKLKLGF